VPGSTSERSSCATAMWAALPRMWRRNHGRSRSWRDPHLQTVRDLMVGSDVTLEHRDTQSLKGVEGAWELFTVTRA
jgi:hypothetical protein